MPRGTPYRIVALVTAAMALTWAGHDRASGEDAAAPKPAHDPGKFNPGPAQRAALANQFLQVKAAAAKGEDDKAEDEVGGIFLPTDRAVKRRLDAAKELIAKDQFSEGVRILGGILEGEEDSFFRTDGRESSFRSLKSESRRLLGELSPKGREAYQLQFGDEARKLLDEALDTGDNAKLAEVSRRFFHTDAGYESTLLLGNYHLDHGRPLAAALTFGQLLEVSYAARKFEPNLSVLAATSWLRAGMDDKAQQVLAQLHAKLPDAALDVAGQSQKIFAGQNKPDAKTEGGQPEVAALAWLKQLVGKQLGRGAAHGDQWVMFRGDESRNGQSRGGLPMLAPPRWRVRFVIDPGIERLVQKMRDAYQRSDVAAPPSLHALAVADVPHPDTGGKRDVVLMRDVKHLMAVDFQTGKRIWVVEPGTGKEKDDGFERLVKSSRSAAPNANQPPQVVQALDQRMWDDAAFGTLSSDGERVYAIEGLDLLTTVFPAQMMGWGRANMEGAPKNFNQLMALDLATEGKRVWVVGGADGGEEDLADAFFLGPPLPISGRLYVLAELKQGISLVVLDAKTGKLEWKQQLADLENSITLDVTRRLAGATPSFADGVLVCPTSAGALVAVDLTSRSLLWAYKHTQKLNPQQQRMMMMRNYQQNQERANDHWIDGTVTIVDGRVLSTPVESAKIYCLNLIDGSEIWTQDRGDNLYVACVHQGKVILVGKKHVTAIQLTDGKHAWQEGMMPLPPNCLPSGRGYYSDKFYYLPVSSGEVIKIDLETGKIAARAKSRDGQAPGNLICFRGEVISQGVDSVETFYQIDLLRDGVAAALKNNPDDPEALARLGELELDADNLQPAIALFRKSFELAPKDLTRELLVKSLLEGLRRDFAANRQLVAELETLIDQPDQRIALLRLLAAGQHKAGEIDAAFDSYLKLVDLDSAVDAPLENDADAVSVRRDRWIKAQLVSLRQAATPEQQQRMTSAVEERFKALPAQPNADQLRAFLKYFDDYTDADLVREQLARILVGSTARLECQLVLRQLERSKSPERQRAAVALMARLLKDAGNVRHAAAYYARLRDELATEVCLDGKSGLELFEALGEEHPVRKALDQPAAFGLGIKTVDVASSTQADNRRLFPVDLEGALGPFFADMTLWFDHQQQTVVGLDGYGGERFRIPLNQQINNETVYMINPNINYGSVNGHLLVISLGHQICAVDTLNSAGGVRPILWKQDLIEQIPGVQAQRTVQPRQVNVQGGITRFRAQDGQGRAIGTIGPVVAGGVTFLRFRDLMSVHPLTGQTQWVRHGVTQGSDLFGDDEILLVVRPNSTEATVLRQSDGALLGTCPVAPEGKRLATLGRRVVSWSSENGKQTLAVHDPWARKEIWSRAFAPNARIWRAEYDTVGVMEPSGKFALLSLEDGRAIAEQQLVEEPALTGIFVLPSRDAYMLVTNHPATQQQPNRSISPAPSGFNNPLVSGRLYSFDRRTGKMRWGTSGSVEQHGLLIPQPSELPMLAFVRHVVTNQNGNNRGPKTSVLLVDKRNGRAIWQKEDFGFGTNSFSISGDPVSQTSTLALPTMNVTVSFTDEPAPPEPPVQAETASTTGKTTQKGIFRIFGAIPKAIDKAAHDTARPRGGHPPEQAEEAPADVQADAEDDDPFGEAKPNAKTGKQAKQAAEDAKQAVEEAAEAAKEAAEDAAEQKAPEQPNDKKSNGKKSSDE